MCMRVCPAQAGRPRLGSCVGIDLGCRGWGCGPCSAGPSGGHLRRQLSGSGAGALGDGADQVLGASLHLSSWPGALSPRAEPAEPGHGSPGVNVGNLGAWCLPLVRPRGGRWGADLGLGIRPLSSPLPLSLAHPRALGPVTNRPPPQVAQALADSAMGLAHRRDPVPAQWVMNN